MNRPRNLVVGSDGEARARGYLEGKGMRFVEANWRCAAGEIDLVMEADDLLVLVEVKARTGEASGRAEETIGATKGSRLMAAADWYVSDHPKFEDRIWRIDLVAITFDHDGYVRRLTHIPDAVVIG